MKPLVIDTNLLVLLLAGNLKPKLIGQHRRLRQFDKFDFERLQAIASRSVRHFSTPNILTEASNFLGSGEQELTAGATIALLKYVDALDEIYVPSKNVVNGSVYLNFGLADATIVDVAMSRDAMVLTSEWPLHGFLEKLGVEAINIFNLKTSRDWS